MHIRCVKKMMVYGPLTPRWISCKWKMKPWPRIQSLDERFDSRSRMLCRSCGQTSTSLSGWLHVLSEEIEQEHAAAAAELYLRLSRGWFVLPPGTRIDQQRTRNYLSAT